MSLSESRTPADPTISVVIITMERKEDLLQAIRSVKDQTFSDCEIIVVDQGSSDGTAEAVRASYPDVHLVALPHNLGVPGGRNLGASRARGRILFFLDDDGVLAPDAFELIAKAFEEDQRLGIVSGKIIDYYSGEFQEHYWHYPAYMFNQRDHPFETYAFSGGLSAIRRSVFEDCGGYDEFLFFAHEERGLALQFAARNWRIMYDPHLVMRHKGQARLGWDHDRFSTYLRARLLVTLVHCPLPDAVPLLTTFIVGHLVQALKNGLVPAYLAGMGGALRDYQQAMSQRRPISKAAYRSIRRMERAQRGPLTFRLKRELFRSRR